MFNRERKDYIISLYDFSPEAEVALNHATRIAGQTGNEVRLLHVINSDTHAKLEREGLGINDLDVHLKSVARRNEAEHTVPTTYDAIEGSIFSTISEYADQLGAVLIVLGTPGVRGLQHVIGANSLRVILSSPIPVFVVQKRKADYHGYKKIVIPIDYSPNGKNKIDYAVAIAKYFNSEIVFFRSGETDPYKAEIVKQNHSHADFLLKIDEIPHSIHHENMKEGSFSRQLIELAIDVDADLMVISSEHKSDSMKDLFFGIHEIDIINNEGEIAVMCVNPLEDAEDLEEDE